MNFILFDKHSKHFLNVVSFTCLLLNLWYFYIFKNYMLLDFQYFKDLTSIRNVKKESDKRYRYIYIIGKLLK